MTKIFCLGLHKTGTATFREAVKQLGWTNFSDSKDVFLKYIKDDDWNPIFEYVRQYDAFKAWPWALVYKELDKEFPNSKFVLTIRDENNWIKSSLNQFWDEETPMREWIFGSGSPLGNEEQHLDVYRKHNKDVVEYFKDRPNDLLVVNWEEGDGWEKLCNFLGKDILDVRFPHANYKKINKKIRGKIIKFDKTGRTVFGREDAKKFDNPLFKELDPNRKFLNFDDIKNNLLIKEDLYRYYKYWGTDNKNKTGLLEEQKLLGKYAGKGKGLDIGCGHNKCNPNAIGFDIFPFKVVDIVGDARDLSIFEDNELDFIVSSHLLEHMSDVKTVLKEWHRVIKIGGIIAIAVPDGETNPIWIASSGHKINLGVNTLRVLFKKVLKMQILGSGIVPGKKGGRQQTAYIIAKKINAL